MPADQTRVRSSSWRTLPLDDQRQGGQCPLFAFQTSRVKPLTRSKPNKFLQVLAKACACRGHNPRHTTTHSLRQGGAVTLFSLGYSDDCIKKAGRWLSGAYEVHLTVPEVRNS